MCAQFLTCSISRTVLLQPVTSSRLLHTYCVPPIQVWSSGKHTPSQMLVQREIPSCHFALLARCRLNIKNAYFPPQSYLKLNSLFFLPKEGDRDKIFSLILRRGKNVYKRGAAILREISKRKCSLENRPTLLYSAYQ